MRWLYLIVSILFLSSIQFIAMSHFRAAPDLLLIFAVFLALNTQREPALVGAWLSGLFSEVSGGQAGHEHIGGLALLFTIFAWTLARHRQVLYVEHWLTRTLVVAAVSFVCGLGGAATVYLETRQSIGWEGWNQILVGVFWTTLFSIPLLVLFARVRRLYSSKRG
jgi:rod shape-determining protein MreD